MDGKIENGSLYTKNTVQKVSFTKKSVGCENENYDSRHLSKVRKRDGNTNFLITTAASLHSINTRNHQYVMHTFHCAQVKN